MPVIRSAFCSVATQRGVCAMTESSGVSRPILLAASGDDNDAAARIVAVDIATRSGAPLHVVHVWHPSTAPGSLSGTVLAAHAASTMAATVQAITDIGGKVAATHLRQGGDADRVLAVANGLHPAVMVVGSRSGSAVQRLFRDSAAEEMVRRSGWPVLVVPGDGLSWPPPEVVVGDDGGKDSTLVVSTGAWLARVLGAPCRLVATQGRDPVLSDATIAKHARLVTVTAGEEPDVVTVTATGHAAARILENAAPDALVVVGRRWPGRIDAREKRTSAALLHHHHGPCLIVPRPLSAASS